MSEYKLVAKYLSGNSSEEEEKQLEEWRKDPFNERVFRELEKIWNLSYRQGDPPDTERAWQRLSARLCSTAPVRKRGEVIITRAAAVAIIFLFVSVLFKHLVEKSVKKPAPAQKIQTAIVMMQALTNDSMQFFYLPDSSTVWLNRKSCLRWFPACFGAPVRTVYLRGDGFFEVAKDSLHPFVIQSARAMVKALGTSFDLHAGSEVIELSVISGEVELMPAGSPGKKLVLHTGETGRMSVQSLELTKETEHRPCTRWWKNIPEKIKKAIDKIK